MILTIAGPKVQGLHIKWFHPLRKNILVPPTPFLNARKQIKNPTNNVIIPKVRRELVDGFI